MLLKVGTKYSFSNQWPNFWYAFMETHKNGKIWNVSAWHLCLPNLKKKFKFVNGQDPWKVVSSSIGPKYVMQREKERAQEREREREREREV